MDREKVFSRAVYSLKIFQLFFPLIELSPQVYKLGFLFPNSTHYSAFNHYIVIITIIPKGWENKENFDFDKIDACWKIYYDKLVNELLKLKWIPWGWKMKLVNIMIKKKPGETKINNYIEDEKMYSIKIPSERK